MTFLDSYSKADRVLFYRLGWHVFYNHEKTFDEYKDFILNKNRYKLIVWDFPFMILFSFIASLIFYEIHISQKTNWIIFLVTILISIILLIIYLGLLKSSKNNRVQSKGFFEFIDYKKRKSNFNFFNALELDNKESAKILFNNFLINEDINILPEIGANHDKTSKLLALDFILGEPGALKEKINSLCNSNNTKITKEGVYRVLIEFLGYNISNTKQVIIDDSLKKIRIKPMAANKSQLLMVKAIFNKAKIKSLEIEVDNLIYIIDEEERNKKVCK